MWIVDSGGEVKHILLTGDSNKPISLHYWPIKTQNQCNVSRKYASQRIHNY